MPDLLVRYKNPHPYNGGYIPPPSNNGGYIPPPFNNGVYVPTPSSNGGYLPPAYNIGGYLPPIYNGDVSFGNFPQNGGSAFKNEGPGYENDLRESGGNGGQGFNPGGREAKLEESWRNGVGQGSNIGGQGKKQSGGTGGQGFNPGSKEVTENRANQSRYNVFLNDLCSRVSQIILACSGHMNYINC